MERSEVLKKDRVLPNRFLSDLGHRHPSLVGALILASGYIVLGIVFVFASQYLVAYTRQHSPDPWVDLPNFRLIADNSFILISLAFVFVSSFVMFRRLARSRQSVMASEERYRNLLDVSMQGIRVMRGRTPLYANNRLAEIYGYESAEEMLRLPSWEVLIAPEERARLAAYTAQRLRGELAPEAYISRSRRKDGSLIWVESRVKLVQWDGAIALQDATIDITKRVEAMQALEASRERYATLLRNLPGMAYRCLNNPPSYSMEFVSDGCVDLTGYPAEALMAGRIQYGDLVHPDDRAAVWSAVDKGVSDGRTFELTYRIRTAAGDEKWVWERGRQVPTEPGGPALVEGFIADVTAEREARNRADRAHTMLTDVIESVPTAFLYFDAEERLVLWNSRMRELSPQIQELLQPGISAADFFRGLGSALIESNGNSGKLEPWLSERLRLLRSAPSQHEQNLKDGRWLQVMDRRTSDGGIISFRFDITDIKKREQELRQMQRLEALGQLTGGVAHDFNNLLQVISGYTTLAARQLERDSVPSQHLARVNEAAGKASQVVQQLLAFSRKQVLKTTLVDLNESVSGLAKMLSRFLRDDIELELRLAPSLDPIHADPAMVDQVLMNLALNARDAMPSGGRLLIETGFRHLEDGFSQMVPKAKPGRYAVLRCSDTGCGIPPDVMERIFEPFFTTKEIGKGTGLGLATVYGIVERHQGGIRVQSQVGEGTTFEVYFKFSAPKEDSVPEEAARAASARGKTILVAEDAEPVRNLVVSLLEEAGHRVYSAADGMAAVELYEQHAAKIDLIILDLVMPRLNGWDAFTRIARISPSVRVLFSSGWYSEREEKQIAESGHALIFKPFPPDLLLRKVDEVLATEGAPARPPEEIR